MAYVVFSGVHASGKTVIAKMIKNKTDFSFLPETDDVVTQNPLDLPPFERQLWFLDSLIAREDLIRKTPGIKIGDRWISDVIRYTDCMCFDYEVPLITLGQRDRINSLVKNYGRTNGWTQPDVEIVFDSTIECLEERIGNRRRTDEQKVFELDMAKKVKARFLDYAVGNTFNREIIILNTTEKTEKETFDEVVDIINTYIKK